MTWNSNLVIPPSPDCPPLFQNDHLLPSIFAFRKLNSLIWTPRTHHGHWSLPRSLAETSLVGTVPVAFNLFDIPLVTRTSYCYYDVFGHISQVYTNLYEVRPSLFSGKTRSEQHSLSFFHLILNKLQIVSLLLGNDEMFSTFKGM